MTISGLEVEVDRPELSGGSSGYYQVEVTSPTTEGRPRYIAECNDIIEALDMRFAEANVFKAVWRRAAARLGNGKPGTSDRYDAEKMVFFSNRELVKSKITEAIKKASRS